MASDVQEQRLGLRVPCRWKRMAWIHGRHVVRSDQRHVSSQPVQTLSMGGDATRWRARLCSVYESAGNAPLQQQSQQVPSALSGVSDDACDA